MVPQIQYEYCFARPGYKAVSFNARQEVRRPIMLVDFPFNFASQGPIVCSLLSYNCVSVVVR